MRNYRHRKPIPKASFKLKRRLNYTGELALGLWAATPESTDPVDSIVKHSKALIREAGLAGPPFRPASYAPLRRIRSITYKPMQIDGRILPSGDGFMVELKKSTPGRESFTLAHEIAHTFFFELVPGVKYRNLYSVTPPDNEEENLCNIAASELLMPFESIATVTRDYSPSLDSLKQIAQIYETSLTATMLRLTSTKLWNIKFVLWQSVGNDLKARWLAEPGKALTRSPVIGIEHVEFSSIRNTLVTGEPTEGEEWLYFGQRFKFCKVSSVRLPNSSVLTAIGATTSLSRSPAKKTPSITLPVEYECNCFGTGTRLVERDGLMYAAKCLASDHRRDRAGA